MKILRTLTAMAAAAAALTIAAQARADVIDFYLNQPECTGSCTTVPPLIADSSAVEVIVTATGSLGDYTGATVEFKAPGTSTIDTPAYINVNGTWKTTYSASVVGDTSGNVGGVTGPGSEDHFGTMTNGTGSEGGFSTVTFTLTALGSNFWTDAADVLTPTTGYAAAYGHGFEAVTAAQDAGYSTAPAPSIGHGLPGILAVAGVLFGAGFLERSRKRRSPGAAISQAAA